MKRSKYTVDYFIGKFKKIPTNKWCAGEINDGKGRKCALGHCGHSVVKGINFQSTRLYHIVEDNLGVSIVDINDRHYTYRKLGKTPKTRVLNALKLIKKGLPLP